MLLQINPTMTEPIKKQTTPGDVAARQLAFAIRTAPRTITTTPGWLTHLINRDLVESGVYHHKVNDTGRVEFRPSTDIGNTCGAPDSLLTVLLELRNGH
jgi:hypothetical protein